MGASAAVNLSYIGQPATSALGGQIIASQDGGPAARTLYGYGTIVSGSTATSVAVNFIDGVQTFGQTFILPLTQVKVDATTNTYADYYSSGPITRVQPGDVVAVTGFTNSGNNVTNLLVSSVNGSYFAASNSGVVAEVNPAATASDTRNSLPVWVDLFYAGNATDSSTAAALFQTGTNTLKMGAVSTTGFTIYYPTVTTSGVTISFGAIVAFSS